MSEWDSIAEQVVNWWQDQCAQRMKNASETPSQDIDWSSAPWWSDLDRLIDAANGEQAGPAIGALFGGIVEVANDGLSRAGRELYGRVFSRAIWRSAEHLPALADGLVQHGISSETELFERYQARRPPADPEHTQGQKQQQPPKQVQHIVLLSRVTLGADVLLNSVLIQHVMQAYPDSRISLVGDGKLTGLLGGCPALRIVPLKYQRRGSLAERLASWLQLDHTIQELQPDLIIGPDSRLDQLGLLPLGAITATATTTATDQQEDAAEIPYLLWENTIDDQPISIADHLDAWCRSLWPEHQAVAPRCWPDQATLDLQQRLSAALGPQPIAAIKLDHGGNPAKSLPREAEVQALKTLRQQGWRILLDRGFGDEEYANSDALLKALEKDFLEHGHGKEGESWGADDICDLDDSGKDMGLPRKHGSPTASLVTQSSAFTVPSPAGSPRYAAVNSPSATTPSATPRRRQRRPAPLLVHRPSTRPLPHRLATPRHRRHPRPNHPQRPTPQPQRMVPPLRRSPYGETLKQIN